MRTSQHEQSFHRDCVNMSAEPLYITLSHSPLKKLNHDHTILLPPLNFWTSPNNPYSPGISTYKSFRVCMQLVNRYQTINTTPGLILVSLLSSLSILSMTSFISRFHLQPRCRYLLNGPLLS